MRNLQEQVKKAFCYQKLSWPFTVWINCSSDLKKKFLITRTFFLKQVRTILVTKYHFQVSVLVNKEVKTNLINSKLCILIVNLSWHFRNMNLNKKTQFRKQSYFLPVFYLIMWIMKDLKKFEKNSYFPKKVSKITLAT